MDNVQISKHNNNILLEDEDESIVVGTRKIKNSIKELESALFYKEKKVNLKFQGTKLHSGKKSGTSIQLSGYEKIHTWLAILEHLVDYEGRTMH